MHCATTHLHLTESCIIPYPDSTHYAESLDIYDGYIYVPLMRGFLASLVPTFRRRYSPSGLYRRRVKSDVSDQWELVFPFIGCTVLGGKVHDGRFVGTDTKNNAILVYDFITKEQKIISVPGCPNDVCFDPDDGDGDVIYVVTNVSRKAKNGLLLRINLGSSTPVCTVLFGRETGEQLNACAGVNVRGNMIYVATLVEVMAIDKRNPAINSRAIIGEKTRDWPFFDNITKGPRNSLLIAVYAHGQRVKYGIIRNDTMMHILMACVTDAGYLDRHNVDQLVPMSNSHIRFARMHSSFYEYVTLDTVIPKCDSEVTQINQLNDTDYVCINYKANGLIFFTAPP